VRKADANSDPRRIAICWTRFKNQENKNGEY
jgi:hypothetical protein